MIDIAHPDDTRNVSLRSRRQNQRCVAAFRTHSWSSTQRGGYGVPADDSEKKLVNFGYDC
jgi:hypothetical protein